MACEQLDAAFESVGFNEFSLEIAYDKDVVKVLQSVVGRQFDRDSSRWIFPNAKYTELVTKLEAMNVYVSKALKENDLNDIVVILLNTNPETDETEFKFPYNEKLIQIFRESDGKFKKESRTWIIPNNKKSHLFEVLEASFIKILNIDDKPKCKF